jgi:hypothetical protein
MTDSQSFTPIYLTAKKPPPIFGETFKSSLGQVPRDQSSRGLIVVFFKKPLNFHDFHQAKKCD